MCLKSMLRIYSKEEFKMFNEHTTTKELYEEIKIAINTAISDKRHHDKNFLLSVIEYQKEEEGELIHNMDKFNRIYTAAINRAANDHGELWFEEAYCLYNEGDFNSIIDFCVQYTKTKDSMYSIKEVMGLLERVRFLPKTVSLLQEIIGYYDIKEDKEEKIQTVIDFLNSLI